MKKLSNVEIKAKCSNPAGIREILHSLNAEFIGTDLQRDTYFIVQTGRLKLREGNIENNLIYYERNDQPGPKEAGVILYKSGDREKLKAILSKSLGKKIIVEKKREIYFIDNVKFHIDEVQKLGNFVEIEAIDENGNIGIDKLYAQCRQYLKIFGIAHTELITNSYSDMLLEKQIVVREGTIAEAVKIFHRIPEFIAPYSEVEFQQRLKGKRNLILIAEFNGEISGFKLGYEQNDCFYSWLGGVLPQFRNKSIADELASFQEKWCRKEGLKKIRLKTRNKFKNMICFALSRGFEIIDFEEKDDKRESRIWLEKKL